MKENNRKGGSSEKFLNKEIILKELNVIEGQTILEIGCGNAYMSEELKQMIKMQAISSVNLGDYFYMQVFGKNDIK